MNLVKRLRLWMFFAVLVAGGLDNAAGQGAAGVTIPSLRAKSLSGETVLLPQALKGKIGILVLGFSQASREQVTAWGKRLSSNYAESQGVVFYEMPVLEQVPRILRGLVLKNIGQSVPARAKGRLLPVLDHEAEWKAATGFEQAEDAYVLVVNESGKVSWTARGTASDEAFKDVKQQVEWMTKH